MNRVRRISTDLLEKYEDSFGENFEDNKKALMTISTITSKELKNEIAGFITKTVKRIAREEQKQLADQKTREEEAAELARLEVTDTEVIVDDYDENNNENADGATPDDAEPIAIISDEKTD